MVDPRVLPNLSAMHSSERRLFQRLGIAVQIEVRVKGDSVPIRSKTTDISVGGCYVEMAVTLELGTPLDVTLWLDHQKLVLQGRVATQHAHFGNGIEFIGVGSEAESRLQCFLEKVENSRVV